MKSNIDIGIESPGKPLPFSTVLPNFRSYGGLMDSKAQSISNFVKSNGFPENFIRNSLKEPESEESRHKKELEYFKQESAYEQNRLTSELKDLKEKNFDLEKRQMLLMNDLDKQSLLLNEKIHEIDYWKNKYLVLESSFSKQNTEQDKMIRMNADLNEVINSWKEKYGQFEKTYLDQQNQFESLKIKFKRLEKKNDQLTKDFNESKEIYKKNELMQDQLEADNEKLRKACQELEGQQQKYLEDIENLKLEFNEFKNNNDAALEDARNEGSKMIQEMHLSYQDMLHKKMQTESQSKMMMEQIKELMNKNQRQETILTEKENKLIELGIKINDAENQISALNFQLAQKDQNLFKMKGEFSSSSHNGNFMSGKLSNEIAPGAKYLEARIEKQQAEIISLKKSMEFNEKYKSSEKFIEAIKKKDKECDELKEKMRALEIKKLDKKSDLEIEDLKFKIVLLSSENERLHTVIKQIKIEAEQNEVLVAAKSKIRDEPSFDFLTNNNIHDNETMPRLSTRTKPLYQSNNDLIYSPTRREERDSVGFFSPTYRMSNKLPEKKTFLMQDYQESSRQLQKLKTQLHASLRKKGEYYAHLKYPQKNY